MKNLLLTLLASATVLLSSTSVAQTTGERMVLYDLKSSSTSLVFAQPFGSLKNAFGSKRDIALCAFLGSSAGGIPVSGFSATTAFKIADNSNAIFGIGVLSPQSSHPRLGLLLGWKLNF